ncbi:protein translocase subunit SecD [Labrys wisconsinensis]|uniref:Protein translocase subunit SecD n=1 Tax=Labrys wisconsinensis TaxID=425677 RepID=A0ABU0J669_9HYPH|nr:protein translocase subunit SecD [Labrys wisconsinensis]MDQ0468779.1 preprotein translocase subunit SecD [Labrys wisconsinensis]
MNYTRWKTAAILGTILIGLWLALPNLYPESWRSAMPRWLPHQPVTLGLDLQGGSQLLLEVDQAAVLKDQVEALREDARRTLRDAKIGFTNLGVQGRSVQLTLRDPNDQTRALDVLRPLGAPANAALFTGGDQRSADVSSGDNGQIKLTVTDFGLNDRMSRVLSRSMEIIGIRVNQLGTTEPSIQRQGADRILVQLPGLQDPSHFKDILGQTAKLEFRLVDPNVSPEQALQTRPPADSEILMSEDGKVPYVVEKRVMVAGEDLTDAQASFDQQNREPVVSFRFNTRGAQQFGRVTQENVGRPFAIVLDNKVISAPNIREPILGGSGQISGNFTTQSANDLALLLRSGALPAPMTVVEERTVGPGLGADSIRAGELAAVTGSGLVVLFMILTYGLFGIIASVAVAINVGLIFGILSLLGATLTLPGIAGVVLTVGIAVDSNVLIYERIREEVRAGRSVLMALDAGFSRALATILDSNITTFIAAAALFMVGTGAVKGFAVTLGVGIITTVFTAFTVTRLLVSWWYRGFKPRTIPI